MAPLRILALVTATAAFVLPVPKPSTILRSQVEDKVDAKGDGTMLINLYKHQDMHELELTMRHELSHGKRGLHDYVFHDEYERIELAVTRYVEQSAGRRVARRR